MIQAVVLLLGVACGAGVQAAYTSYTLDGLDLNRDATALSDADKTKFPHSGELYRPKNLLIAVIYT
jgi:hypothetical protein